jgi:hypothetical protein
MRLWSRGLGRLVLPIELGKARLDLTPQHFVLSGTIREGKVVWEYRLKLDEGDLLGFSRVACEREVLDFLARQHGLGLLLTIAVRTLGFVAGLVLKTLGRGAPLTAEEALAAGPQASGKARRGEHGVLVERAR